MSYVEIAAALTSYEDALDAHTDVVKKMRRAGTGACIPEYLATLQVIRETRATLEAEVRKES